MNQIGFHNFRKFQSFPNLDLSPITIFVGENNAGKSTVVKAILSVLDFLGTEIGGGDDLLGLRFFFNKSFFTHVGTFQRALNNSAKEGVITFTASNGLYRIQIEMEGDKDDEQSISAQISEIVLTILPFNIDLDYKFKSGQDRLIATFHSTPSEYYKDLSAPYDTPAMRENYHKARVKYFKDMTKDIEVEMPISNGSLSQGRIIEVLLDHFYSKVEATVKSLNNKAIDLFSNVLIINGLSKDAEDFLRSKRTLLLQKPFVELAKNDVARRASFGGFEYIYAHAVTQTVIYSAKDINDYFVRTIHDFANQRIEKETEVYKFIVRWMKIFRIGIDYEVSSFGGEAHIVKIKNSDDCIVNLADKGMGSIQLMILLFRLASMMANAGIQSPGQRRGDYTIIVEEPEQNLHPKLQSKLADLFLEMYELYGFKFIIESHSEYLIRRTQILIAEKGFKSDEELKDFAPFKVIYFPGDDKEHYDMLYRTDGKFSNEFGPGFFDEAANLAFKIF